MTHTDTSTLSGAAALALGAMEAGVRLVTGYPGAPVTAVVNQMVGRTMPDQVQVTWNSNEKAALEMAFGASVGGMRALLCVKSVGLNVALDPLMAFNLSGCNAGLVLLVGDDPGGWGSQNEQDSRVMAWAADVPMLEPTTVAQARAAMHDAVALSEDVGTPVFVRITRALVQAEAPVDTASPAPPPAPPGYEHTFMRWVVLPINVVPHHQRLQDTMTKVQARFESSARNRVQSNGKYGIIAAGVAYHKLMTALNGTLPMDAAVLELGTFHPLPTRRLTEFMGAAETVLVLEDNAPWVERALRAMAQRAGLPQPIYGRETQHVPRTGELFPAHIAQALNRFIPALSLPTGGETSRPMPSRQALCEGCPYIPVFDALTAVMAARGGRERFIITGDPGCMVRGQLPPYELLDAKNSLGSSIGMGAGLALSQQRLQTGKRVIALSGDSSLLHSGFAGLMDAARVGAPLLVLVLDNGTTALSGGQPHPGTPVDIRGQTQAPVDLAAVAQAAGATKVQVVEVDAGADVEAAVSAALDVDGVAVLIARGRCRGNHGHPPDAEECPDQG